MIYTARTEASRLPLITHEFEQNVTHDAPRKDFNLPYAKFLKIHYKGLTTMPGDEADGCEPRSQSIRNRPAEAGRLLISPTPNPKKKIVRTGSPSADHVEHRLALPDEPKNVIDLSWKIMPAL